ncbi:mechanosensitive ion channel family protein [Rubrivirga sp.]|uniref:mechanosensitive ion channel family protein n=1 Tax=Rubrivirga sp. TaxID=1885344 RepID=UPI003C78DF4F
MPQQPADTLFQGTVPVDTALTLEDIVDDTAPDTTTIADDLATSTTEAMDTVQGFIDGFYAALPRVAVGVVVFLFIWVIAKVVRNIVHRVTPGPTDSSIGIVLGRLTYAALLVLGILIALVVVFPTFTIGSLLGALGLGGVALGFAFQDIFQNLLAGILILLREPFRTGDEITSGEYTGTVESIETRATFIRTYDGRRVIIPNSQIYSDPVQVITAYQMVRSQYDIGIGYGDDIEQAKRIALETLQSIDGIKSEPAPDVITWDLAGSSVNLRVRWWSNPTRSNVVALRDKVLRQVSRALLAQGIDLPFPTQQILFHDQTEATDGDRTQQREGWPVPADGQAPPPARIAMTIRASGSALEDDPPSTPRASELDDGPPPADA